MHLAVPLPAAREGIDRSSHLLLDDLSPLVLPARPGSFVIERIGYMPKLPPPAQAKFSNSPPNTVPMLAKIFSAAVFGVDAFEVEIEVNGGRGDPVIIIVGLPDAAVKESKDRVTTAIHNSGYRWAHGRMTINLA